MSDIALGFFIVTFILGMVGYSIRYKKPRIAGFFICLMLICVGIWALTSTYELFSRDEARYLSRSLITFKKTDNPDMFLVSTAFHALLGLFITAFGFWGILKTLTKPSLRFYK